MTDTFKVLGQFSPAAVTLHDLYTVPASTQAVLSSIVVCNRDPGATTFRLSVAIDGAVDDVAQYLNFDTPIAGNDSIACVLGITLGTGDIVRVQSGSGLVSFNACGEEVTP